MWEILLALGRITVITFLSFVKLRQVDNKAVCVFWFFFFNGDKAYLFQNFLLGS